EYHDICEFIGAEDDGRQDFPPVRESQSHVFRPLSRMIMAPPAWFRPVATVLRRRAHQRPAGMLSRVKGLLRRKRKRITLRPEFEQHLREVFAPEVDRLEDLLGRSLDAWRREPARPNLEPVTH
ncbi:MAG TPA: hypothetical protein VHB77_18455, partial [Planctomycetaceae bacterium]|nr:hypothetical protein [Planctomycetaceae bacterium]